jgi:hypothetical protein
MAVMIMMSSVPAMSDEGMWLYNDPPRQLLKQKYGFEPTDAWLEHLQKSSVRFNSGGSGSFVSADGLIISKPTPAPTPRRNSGRAVQLSPRWILCQNARRGETLPGPGIERPYEH